MTDVLDLTGPLPTGRLVVEASAGTGKTYSLSALVVRHVAERGLAASSLLVVTFTRAAAAELRDRTRKALVLARDAVVSGDIPDDQPWMSVLLDPPALREARAAALRAAVETFDDATVTTIHGFCQQALRQLGVRSGTGLDAELGDSTPRIVDEVCRDLVVAELLHDPHALDWPVSDLSPAKVFASLRDAVTAVLGNPGAGLVPTVPPATPHKDDTPERLARWVALVREAVAEVGVRRRAARELGYDDLVTGLRDAVRHPVTGPSVVQGLDERYQLVLVDEFQDTDPVQWDIFATAFSGHLVTVGDPKQAIYRFRGADVQAYLAATAGGQKVMLGTNQRSDAALVRATNTLIRDVQWGDPRIVGTPVEASRRKPEQALSPGAPLQIRRMPAATAPTTPKGNVSVPLVRRAIVADVAQQVVELLQGHRIGDGPDAPLVQPGDIAVLVPTHGAAEQVVRALDRVGVPSVRTRTGSVLVTPAANQWALLLAALERPSHPPTVRAAGLSVFLHRRAVELDPAAPDAAQRLAELQRRCAEWADALTSTPFLAWYLRVRAESELVGTLLAEPGGERRLTDLDHIAEVQAAELGAGGVTAAVARRTLDRLRAASADAAESEAQMRRIDSDAQAVQITTLHGSKGLEYPVVLLPLSWTHSNSKGVVVYNDPDTGERLVDVASGQLWDGPDMHSRADGRKFHAHVGERGDRLRLLYVGLTRGEHRTIVWWAPTDQSKKSALSTVLFDRDEAGAPCNTQPRIWVPRTKVNTSMAEVANPSDDDAQARLEQLVVASGGTIAAAECPVGVVPSRWEPHVDADRLPTLAVATAQGRAVADRAWRRWSFTSITRTLEQDWSPTSTVAGGTDEPQPVVDGDAPAVAPSAVGPAIPLADVLAGAAFGTLVHTVLERVDHAADPLPEVLGQEVQLQLRRDRLDVSGEVLTAGLVAAVRTPLGPLLDGRCLADIPATDRLAELDFDMPLWSGAPRVTAVDVGRVLLATLPADDPQLAYAQSLADGRFTVELAGFLQGSIDAVLRVPDAAHGHRYVVLDYKTNRLHTRDAADPMAAYHPSLLPAAMAHSDYPLQSILYSVAVHRYLRWRLPDYSPEHHLGGIAYLFVRGMVGASTPQADGHPFGVFSWRPPAATVVALDRLLAEGAA